MADTVTSDDQARPSLTSPLMPSDPTSPDTDQWPLRDHLQLPATPQAVGRARKHARLMTDKWGLTALSDSVEVIVSEMVTNSVRAATSHYRGAGSDTDSTNNPPPVQLWLFSSKHEILIQVWDTDDRQPARRPSEPTSENGRGLLIVESLSTSWGTSRAVGTPGKLVWARVS